jgi:molybdopterin-guanine dinucleotide biosynthesis protein B
MRVAAVIGPSNSGKTTLLCALIRYFVTEGRSVAAIKHTHHALNDERRGDTEHFLNAGATTAILASDGRAVVFESDTRMISYDTPTDLLQHVKADIVLVEGFKDFGGWPRLDARHIRTVDDALLLIDRIA